MMGLMENLKLLSVPDNDLRRQNLLEILNTIGCNYVLETYEVAGESIHNIKVLFSGCTEDRVILAAHYDSVKGSVGANDNAAAVSILIACVEELIKEPARASLEIVFFDHEEATETNSGMLGSKLYLEHNPHNVIRGMLNLDICGVGEVITIAPQKNTTIPPFRDFFALAHTSKIALLDQLPPGDDFFFEKAGIPNLSICMLPEGEEKIMRRLFSGEEVDLPSIVQTMHNGERDYIDVIDEEAMNQLFRWVMDFIRFL